MHYVIVDVCSRDKNQEEQDWHKICVRALEVFQSKCEDIMSGRVTVNDLTNNIKPGEKKLLEIANIISLSNVSTIKCPKSDAIKSAIQKRVNEREHFSGFQLKMGLLFGKFARVQGNCNNNNNVCIIMHASGNLTSFIAYWFSEIGYCEYIIISLFISTLIFFIAIFLNNFCIIKLFVE